MGFHIDKWMVAWNPGEPDSVLVGPWPDTTGWSNSRHFTDGCCWTARQRWPLEQKVAQMFIDFHTMVVRDGISPSAAHREFLKIDEYRRRIAEDIPGAEG